ncbi:Pectate-lyase-3 domain containing protein [Pyrenophora tritici-repentis]|nr:Pectate-lyase-3 domain containing protein [Pyrenophora tritici-repentis]
MGSIDHKGTVPWGGDASYKVFRNVRSYGAVGDGVTDDTKAFKNAMSDGKRCAVKCNGSTVRNAIVYIPPGTYVISSTIVMPFGTQVIGDANARPTLKASKSFIGMGVLSTDEYTGGGTGTDGLDQQYFVNTANFYRQLRNLIIDVTQTRTSQKVACLHYQVAQATSTQNLLLIAGSSGYGMYAENGSGGQISDVEFQGGTVGLFGGSQQFIAQRLKFSGCTVGVQLIWDWGWAWKSIEMNNVSTGFKLVPDSGSGSSGGSTATSSNIGSASFLDSSFNNANTVVVVEPPSKTSGTGTTGLVLENIKLSGVTAAVVDNTGATILGVSSNIGQWTYGPIYKGSADTKDRDLVTATKRAKPQYEDRSMGDFVHLKDLGARGDGVTDDTAAFQSALYAAVGKILFIDAGSYILTLTVTIPSGSKLVGETWSQLAASGTCFSDALNPKVMLKVETSGQVGDVEMQDLLFTTVGPTTGAILVEWNIQASSPGAAGLWDCHARIGGATGTKLTPAECPPLTSGTAPGCNASSLTMHLTKTGSGHFENMWLWGSDHTIDDPNMNDANKTMLYGTASEHAVFYQFNFNKASRIFAGLIQTESPYYQPTPQPPAPFTSAVGVFAGDPTYKCTAGDEFSGCDESWAVFIRESMNIFIASAGLYSWFSTYAQTCIDQQLCQKALMLLEKNYSNVRINHLVTIGAKYMAVMDGKGIPAKDNLNVNMHPFWSQISVLDVSANRSLYDEFIWIDPKIWDMDDPKIWDMDDPKIWDMDVPKFTCSPPDGSWTSTITKAPITISEWWFEAVTLSGGNGAAVQRRQSFELFWPIPEKTSAWPAVVYTDPDGSSTIKAPTIPFPTPPPSIDPNAPPTPTGSWPKRQLEPYIGQYESPLVEQCAF